MMRHGRSLRWRILTSLAVVIVPVTALSLVWSFEQDKALRAAAGNVDDQDAYKHIAIVDTTFAEARFFAASLEAAAGSSIAAPADSAAPATASPVPAPNAGAVCARLYAALPSAGRRIDGAAFMSASQPLCHVGAAGERAASLAAGLAARLGSDTFAGPHLFMPQAANNTGGELAYLVPAGSAGEPYWTVLLIRDPLGIASAAQPEGALQTAPLPPRARAALIAGDGKVLAARSGDDDERGESWLPPTPPGLKDLGPGGIEMGVVGPSREGGRFRYTFAAVPGTDATFVLAQPPIWVGDWPATLESIVQILLLVALTVFAAVWTIDRVVGQWVNYLRRIAFAHSQGRLSVRAKRLENAPSELAELGAALNRMADKAGEHAHDLEASVTGKAILLRELHHRVKNNFQVITSLLSLHKRAVPAERQDDIRFVEDHVQAMAIAYRVAYSVEDANRVSLLQLMKEVVSALRETAQTSPERAVLRIEDGDILIDLDKGVALGLFLAAFLPPSLDRLRGGSGILRIDIRVEGPELHLSIRAPIATTLSPLRERLVRAYVRQMRAAILPDTEETRIELTIPIGDDQPDTRGRLVV